MCAGVPPICDRTINNTRFKLETKKRANPDSALVADYDAIPKFAGSKGGIEELRHYAEVAPKLGDLMERWNKE